MIRTLSVSFFFLALSLFANHNPISEFPSGQYLGEGHLVYTNGAEASYATYATINSDELNFSIVRGGELFAYNLYFEFGENGFFTVTATENRYGEETTHYGQGYCQSVQCHFSFDLDNGRVEETLTFATWENKIYTIGSMYYYDENGDQQAISWEEGFFLLDFDGDSDDDGGDGEGGAEPPQA